MYVCVCVCVFMYVCTYVHVFITHTRTRTRTRTHAQYSMHHLPGTPQSVLSAVAVAGTVGGACHKFWKLSAQVHSLHKVSTYRGLLKMGAILFTTCATVGPRPSHGPHSPIRPCPSIVNIPVRIRGRFPSAPPERQKSYLALSRPV
jgi:hypothetical protein